MFDSRDGARCHQHPATQQAPFHSVFAWHWGEGTLHPSLSIKTPQLLSDIFLLFLLSFFVSYHMPKFPSEGEHFPWKFHF